MYQDKHEISILPNENSPGLFSKDISETDSYSDLDDSVTIESKDLDTDLIESVTDDISVDIQEPIISSSSTSTPSDIDTSSSSSSSKTEELTSLLHSIQDDDDDKYILSQKETLDTTTLIHDDVDEVKVKVKDDTSIIESTSTTEDDDFIEESDLDNVDLLDLFVSESDSDSDSDTKEDKVETMAPALSQEEEDDDDGKIEFTKLYYPESDEKSYEYVSKVEPYEQYQIYNITKEDIHSYKKKEIPEEVNLFYIL